MPNYDLAGIDMQNPSDAVDRLTRLLGLGRKVAIKTRQGGGLGDPTSPFAAKILKYRATYPIFGDDENPNVSLDDGTFRDEMMLPFVSSNVEGGYFIQYSNDENMEGLGSLYLKFQKRRPETPSGEPVGAPRAYWYTNVPRFVWESFLSAASPGGTVWDVVRRGGIDYDMKS